MPSELKLPEGFSSEEVRVNPMRVLKKIFNQHSKEEAIAFVDSYEASIPDRAPNTIDMGHTLKNMREFLQQPEAPKTSDSKGQSRVSSSQQVRSQSGNVSQQVSRSTAAPSS